MDDLISRQAAIDAVNEDWNLIPDTWDCDGLHPVEIERILNSLPSAQPDRSCNTCRYNYLEWHEEPCDSCTSGGESNHWKPTLQRWISCDDYAVLPSAQPEPQWIPCSERLPVEIGNYLVTTSRGGVWAKRWDSGWCGNKNNNNIKAWMPLPEPYKEENR